jgi:hypothetical protein
MEVGLVELAFGHLFASAGQHLGRRVDTDHPVAERREVRGMPAGAAGGVERNPLREAVEDLPDDQLLELEVLVPRLVVGRRPAGVALLRGHRTRLDPLAKLVNGVEERLHLAQASDGEVAVVGARERPEQRDPSRPRRYAKGCW